MKKWIAAVFLAAFAALSSPSLAQDWKPERPIELMVGYTAGGGTDIIARIMAEASQQFLPQPIVVVNRPGASGTIGAELVKEAAPDGSMMLMGGGSESTSVPANQKVNYDIEKDFKSILMVTKVRFFVFVRPDSPWKTIDDMLTDVKANPGKYSYGTSGNGTLFHSTMMMISDAANLDMLHVPYQGGAELITSVMSGQVDVAIAAQDELRSHKAAGTLRLLAVASEDRYQAWDDIPTLKEKGVDVIAENMKGLMVPAATPQYIIDYYRDVFKKTLESDKFKELAGRAQLEAVYLDGPAFQKAMIDTQNKIRAAISAQKKN